MKQSKTLMSTIFIFLFLLLTTSSFAQEKIEPQIDWTKDQLMGRKRDVLSKYTFLQGDYKSFIFLYDTSFRNFFSSAPASFVKMDMESGEPKHLSLELKDNKVKREWKQVRNINGEIYIFSTFKNKKDKKHYVFVETLNTDKLEYNNDVHKIGEISYEDVEGSDLSDFVVTLSPNKERILLGYSITYRGEITSLCLQVLDKDMNALSTRVNDFPRIEGTDVTLSNYTIDNEGNVYITQKKHDLKDEQWELFLTCFPIDNKEEPRFLEMKFDSGQNSVSETILCSPKGEILLAGLYSRSGKESVVGTYSYLCTSQLGAILSKDEKEFDDAFITMGMLEKDITKMLDKKDKDKEFDEGFEYNMDSKMYRQDGGYSIMVEKYKLEIRRRTMNNMVFTTYYHNFNDIMILTYNEAGSIRWIQKVPKQQRLADVENLYGSYKALIDEDDNIEIIFNENVGDKMSEKAQAIFLKIDSEGKMSFKEIIFDDKEVRKSFAPLLVRKFENDKYLVGRINASTRKGLRIQWGITELSY